MGECYVQTPITKHCDKQCQSEHHNTSVACMTQLVDAVHVASCTDSCQSVSRHLQTENMIRSIGTQYKTRPATSETDIKTPVTTIKGKPNKTEHHDNNSARGTTKADSAKKPVHLNSSDSVDISEALASDSIELKLDTLIKQMEVFQSIANSK